MKWLALPIALLALTPGCADQGPADPAGAPKPATAQTPAQAQAPAAKQTLAEARRGFVTQPGPAQEKGDPLPEPPAGVFERITFPSPVGNLAAYVTPDPEDGQKHPAILWITGGDCNSIGEVWKPRARKNDQTAAAYRKAGLVLMFPSLRGGNENPGRREGFLGEVDDVLAAADALAARPYVDRSRIYLGGHSTGGTLVMLVAEMSDRFRATFAFGPAGDVRGYGGDFVYHAPGDLKESIYRSPQYWLDDVKAPLFVIEGTGESGNIDTLRQMRATSKNPMVHFVEVEGVDHFSILAPANDAIAAKLVADTGPTSTVTLAASDIKVGR